MKNMDNDGIQDTLLQCIVPWHLRKPQKQEGHSLTFFCPSPLKQVIKPRKKSLASPMKQVIKTSFKRCPPYRNSISKDTGTQRRLGTHALLSLAFQFIIIRSYFLSDHISP
jgi:hypothetical protein